MSERAMSFWQKAIVTGISVYQRYISTWLPPTCRFYPSCSLYASQAIANHGVWRGGWLAAKRILRCHPFSPGGIDPVPGTESDQKSGDNL